MTDIILPSGGYKKLKAYQKSEVIYQGTVAFCRRFLPTHGDRTVDQMVQAARSCKQNIAEGSASSGTSKETELKLTGVAKATLDELLEDYEDFLKRRGLVEWPASDARKTKMREWARDHNDWTNYSEGFSTRDPETLANLMMTLIHQEHALIDGMLRRQEAEFKQYGGIRERMTRARHESRADGLEMAIYSRLQEAQTPGQIDDFVASIWQNAKRTGEKIKRMRGW